MSNNMSESNNGLSAEQIKMIEEKRLKAIQLRNERSLAFLNNNNPNNRPIIGSNPTNNYVKSGNTDSMTNIKSMTQIPRESKYFHKKSPYSRPNTSGKSNTVKKELIASIRLKSNKRFELLIPFDPEVVTICRKIQSKEWDPNTKNWSFDIKDYKELMNELKSIPSVEVKFGDAVPEPVLVTLTKVRNKDKQHVDLKERLSTELVDELFPFQREGVLYGIEREGRCLIADDMGLGKTIQAICLAQWFKSDWPLIIVCPSSLRYQWLNSLNRWLPHVSNKDILVITDTKEHLSRTSITIISYDLLARRKNLFDNESKRFYNMVILDESHYIKTESAARTEAVLLLAKSAKRAVLLTGTPALSRPMELYPQIRVIDPKLFSSKHAFGVRYCDAQQKSLWVKGGRRQQVWDYKGAKNLDELRILLEATIMIRRLKIDVLDQLPRKKREMIILSIDHLTEKHRNKLKGYHTKMRRLCKKEGNTCLFEWYGESASAKVEPVCEYVEQMLDKDIKLLCFCHHKQMMDGIEEMLAKKQVNHIRIDGSTPAAVRQEACDEFQNRSECKIALLSITACATGLNLTAASTVIFSEIYWNPGIIAQAEDRVHRIGQQENVRIIYLVAKDTVDDLMWPLISKKLDVLNKAGLSKDNFNEATCTLDALANEQQMITEFFKSIDEKELKALFSDDFTAE